MRRGLASAAIVEMIHAGEIILHFDLSGQTAAVLALLKKYRDRDLDLADACIVRMTELMRDGWWSRWTARTSPSIAATGAN